SPDGQLLYVPTWEGGSAEYINVLESDSGNGVRRVHFSSRSHDALYPVTQRVRKSAGSARSRGLGPPEAKKCQGWSRASSARTSPRRRSMLSRRSRGAAYDKSLAPAADATAVALCRSVAVILDLSPAALARVGDLDQAPARSSTRGTQ